MIHDEGILRTREQFGARVRVERKRQGLSQARLGLMIGMDRTYISGVEHGKRNISFDNIVKIAQGLDVSLAKLMDGVGAPPSHSEITYFHGSIAPKDGLR